MAETVQPSDLWGESVVDTFYRGGGVFVVTECMVYAAASLSPFWPYATFGQMGQVGRRGSDIAAAHVLTVIAGTPAVGNPNSLTATKALLAENSNLRLVFTSKLRRVPLRLRYLPDTVSGNVTWFATA